MDMDILKPVIWIGSSYTDWKAFPPDVQDVMGYALHLAQLGSKAGNTKPLKTYKGGKVLEIWDNHGGNTWRAIYTVQFRQVVYVLHAFQKKSRKGIATPITDIRLINKRLQQAAEHYEANKT